MKGLPLALALSLGLWALILGACSTARPYPPLEKPLLLNLVPMQPGDCPDGAWACFEPQQCDWELRICTLYLPAEDWLEYLCHEARHGNEGYWHGTVNEPSCY